MLLGGLISINLACILTNRNKANTLWVVHKQADIFRAKKAPFLSELFGLENVRALIKMSIKISFLGIVSLGDEALHTFAVFQFSPEPHNISASQEDEVMSSCTRQ